MTDKELVEFISSEFVRRQEARRSLELTWELNRKFLLGEQYAEILPTGEVEELPGLYAWQRREVFNHIAPIMETRLAKLARAKSQVSVRSAAALRTETGEQDGQSQDLSTFMNKGRAKHFLNGRRKRTGTVQKNNLGENLQTKSEIFAPVFARPTADAREAPQKFLASPFFQKGDKDLALTAADERAKELTRILREYSVKLKLSELVNKATYWSELYGTAFYRVYQQAPASTDVKPGSRPARGTAFYGVSVNDGEPQVEVVPPQEIFPEDLEKPLSENKSIIRAYEHEQARTPRKPQSETKAGGGVSVLHIEYYADGELIVVEGDEIVLKTACLHMPFVPQKALATDTFFGTSLIERMIPVQRAYNAVKNRKHEFINRLAMGVLAVEDGSVDTDALEDDGLPPGKIVVYRQGANPPTMLGYGSVPAELTVEEERLLQEFIILSGISELSKFSHAPSNVTSGVALAILAEQDDTKISTTAENIRNAVLEISRRILSCACGGSDNGDWAGGWAGELVFDFENELADTPVNRKATALELVKMGLLHDETGKLSNATRAKVLDLLGFKFLIGGDNDEERTTARD